MTPSLSLLEMPTTILSSVMRFLGTEVDGRAYKSTCKKIAKCKFSKYAVQVIFTLLGGKDVAQLQEKAINKELKTIIIDLRSFIKGVKQDTSKIEAQFSKLRALPTKLDEIRLYYDSHGNYYRYGVVDFVSKSYQDGSRDRYSPEKLVTLLKTHAPQLIQQDRGKLKWTPKTGQVS